MGSIVMENRDGECVPFREPTLEEYLEFKSKQPKGRIKKDTIISYDDKGFYIPEDYKKEIEG